MFTVVCDYKIRDDVWDFMLTELSKMYLHSMALLNGRNSTYEKEDYELIDRAKDVIRQNLEVKKNKNGFSIESLSTDLCFSLASELENENSYHDGYLSNEKCSINFALQNVIDKYPGITIQGDFEVDSSHMYFIQRISTKDSQIFVEEVDDEDEDGEDDEDDEEENDEEDDDKSIEGEETKAKYDENAFLEYALEKHPYKEFLGSFKINNAFSEKMYKEFLLSNFLYKATVFYREGYTYEGFKMDIWLCIFEDNCVGVSEDDYKSLFEKMEKDLNDNSRFAL